MKKRISRKKARLIAEIESVLKEHYITLHLVQTDPYIVVRGVFPVRLEHTTIDQYFIEIAVPDNYPKQVPIVHELGKRIPVDLDFHVVTDGSLCLFLPDERWKYWGNGKVFLDFLQETVNDFFLGQVYHERHHEFPFGERRHGILGILDYYEEELGTDDVEAILRCLTYLSKRVIKGHWDCFCGSDKRLRQCHGKKMRDLRNKIPPETAQSTVMKINSAIQMLQEQQNHSK